MALHAFFKFYLYKWSMSYITERISYLVYNVFVVVTSFQSSGTVKTASEKKLSWEVQQYNQTDRSFHLTIDYLLSILLWIPIIDWQPWNIEVLLESSHFCSKMFWSGGEEKN